MIKTKYFAYLLAAQTALCTQAFAGVNFILDADEDTANQTTPSSADGEYAEKCAAKGFSVKSSTCTGNKLPGLLCPLNPDYTDKCCSAEYIYVITSSCTGGTVAAANDTCGGRYRCVCDPVMYPYGDDRLTCEGKFAYDTINYCTQIVYADNGTPHHKRYYKGCACNGSYAQCNSGYNLHGIGDACSYNSNVYYKQCICNAGYNKLCNSSGPADSNDYCLFNGKKYYRSCVTAEADDKQDSDAMNSTDQ